MNLMCDSGEGKHGQYVCFLSPKIRWMISPYLLILFDRNYLIEMYNADKAISKWSVSRVLICDVSVADWL